MYRAFETCIIIQLISIKLKRTAIQPATKTSTDISVSKFATREN